MNTWAFALTRRWFGYLTLAVVFAIVCSLLGVWQLNRRAEARAEIDRVDSNYSSEPVPLTTVLESIDSFDVGQKWTPVVLTGRYLRDDQLLVRNRPFGGNAGFEVLTPLLLGDGTVFVVDRGWVPTGSEQDSPDHVPDAPDGEVSVVARLNASEPTLPGRSAPDGQVATIHLPTVAETIGKPTYTGAYGLLVSETPPAAERPVAAVKPPRDEGPHLSYALQWFVFAVFGFLGLGYALREEYRLVNVDDPEERKRATKRRAREATRARTDGEVEDEIIDASRR